MNMDRNFVAAVINMLIASVFFAAMGAVVKIIGTDYSSVQVVFFRNLFGTLVICMTLFRKPMDNKGGRPGLLILRGVAGTIALYALYYNMAHIGLGIAITFLQTSPIFVAVFSHYFLGEKLSLWTWLAIFIGFSGIILIFRPNVDGLELTDLLGLACGVFAGIGYTALRGLRSHYERRTIVLSFMVSGAILPLVSFLLAYLFPEVDKPYLISSFRLPQGIDWLFLVLVGVTALGGQYFLTKAYTLEKAGIMSAIGYMTIPVSMFIGILLGDNWPDMISVAGVLLIIGGGSIISIKKS